MFSFRETTCRRSLRRYRHRRRLSSPTICSRHVGRSLSKSGSSWRRRPRWKGPCWKRSAIVHNDVDDFFIDLWTKKLVKAKGWCKFCFFMPLGTSSSLKCGMGLGAKGGWWLRTRMIIPILVHSRFVSLFFLILILHTAHFQVIICLLPVPFV